jgi:hypothetical protein
MVDIFNLMMNLTPLAICLATLKAHGVDVEKDLP